MQHFSITDINPAMAHARRVIGAFEEHQITGFPMSEIFPLMVLIALS